MKFRIGDLVTRPYNVHEHDYDNKRSVRIKGVDESARIAPHTLVGTVIFTYRDFTCMEGMEGQEHTHNEIYDVIWRNWVHPRTLVCKPTKIEYGLLEHGIQLIEPKIHSIAEIKYVAKNMHAEMRRRKLSTDPMIHFQAEQMELQLNALGWVVKKMPKYLEHFEKGGQLDTRS